MSGPDRVYGQVHKVAQTLCFFGTCDNQLKKYTKLTVNMYAICTLKEIIFGKQFFLKNENLSCLNLT